MGLFDFKSAAIIELSEALDYKTTVPDMPDATGRRRSLFGGIDVGKHGYFAVVDMTGKPSVVFVEPMPLLDAGKGAAGYDLQELWRVVQRFQAPEIMAVALELQHAFPGQGGVSNFSLGYGYGMLRAFLTAAGVSHDLVSPQRWKRDLKIKGEGDDAAARKADGKRRSVTVAQSLYPSFDFRHTTRSKKPSVDMAEAVLLATYAGRQRLGITG